MATNTNDRSRSNSYTKIVIVQKSRRVGHLLFSSKNILIYLQLWQLSLIICNVFLIVASVYRSRNNLLHDRSFYYGYLIFTVLLIAWLVYSITIWHCEDNLSHFTNLGLLALLLGLIDVIILCRLLVGFSQNDGIHGKSTMTVSIVSSGAHFFVFPSLMGSEPFCLTFTRCESQAFPN